MRPACMACMMSQRAAKKSILGAYKTYAGKEEKNHVKVYVIESSDGKIN